MPKENTELLKFNAEVSKVLQLMIHSLYTNKDIFVRELVSNASDACDKLRHAALVNPELAKDDPDLKITLAVDKKNRTVTVRDNGIGMSRDELIRNLGTIAKSGTQEFLSQLEAQQKKGMPLIGQFGVGFYSSFMAADKVTVVSRPAGENDAWQWESDGQGEFSVSPAEKSPRGTSVTLHLKQDADQYLDTFRLRHIVQTYSDHISFPIAIIGEEGGEEVVNTASALWVRSKNDITPEQYKEFYHHVAHQPDDPWLTLHHKAEGKLDYVSLLFVPSLKPFDLFSPESKRRVKLYVKRVFITEENVEVVPRWLRFLRGIIDSEDLPLNISRETLQANPLLGKIRDAVVRRVLADLKKKAAEDAEGYRTFWDNFGAVLKEGLCEGTSPREEILEICRFHSTGGDGMTGLDAYLSRMKAGQEQIYYLSGENVTALQSSPQIEGFKKRGIEVLLFTDHVDDFWTSVVPEYKGKKFKSATRADIDMDTVAETKPEDKKPETKTDADAVKALCARIKGILGDKVKEVRTTNKLDQSAVCLGVEEGAMDLRLERFLVEQKQLPAAAAKILEINPEHPIIRALTKMIPPSTLPPQAGGVDIKSPPPAGGTKGGNLANAQEFENVVWLLFDQACILEGQAIADPASFTRRLQSFVEKSLAA